MKEPKHDFDKDMKEIEERKKKREIAVRKIMDILEVADETNKDRYFYPSDWIEIFADVLAELNAGMYP